MDRLLIHLRNKKQIPINPTTPRPFNYETPNLHLRDPRRAAIGSLHDLSLPALNIKFHEQGGLRALAEILDARGVRLVEIGNRRVPAVGANVHLL